MFRLFSDLGLVLYDCTVDGLIATLRMGSITWTLQPWCAHCWLIVGFFLWHTLHGHGCFFIPRGSHGWVSSQVFLLYWFCFLRLPVPSLFFYVIDMFSTPFVLLQALTIVKSSSWSRSSSFRCLVRGHPGHRKTVSGPLTCRWVEFAKDVLSVPVFPLGPMDCALYLRFLLVIKNVAWH